MIVRENINFERGLDPKEAMGIGKVKLINDWMGQVPGIYKQTIVTNENYKGIY